jgi:hypothetical protein
MMPSIRRSLMVCLAVTALSGCAPSIQAPAPAPAQGQLSVQLMPWEGEAEAAEAPVRYRASLVDAGGAVVATREVPAGAPALDFAGVPQGTYTLAVTAWSKAGRVVNHGAPAPVVAGTYQIGSRATIGQAIVPMLRIDGGYRLGPNGRFTVDVSFSGGHVGYYDQGPLIAAVSKPASQGYATAPDALSAQRAYAVDDEERCYLKDEIAPSLAYKYTAFTTTREGTDLTYMGPATLQLRSGADAENGAHPTLQISYGDQAVKLYMDADGALIGGGSPYPAKGAPGSFAYLDPEPVAGAKFHNEQYPTGTPARRYYWQLADYAIADLYMGANPHDGLYAFRLPVGDRVLHVVKL